MPEVWERPRRPPCSVVGQAAHDLYCDTETKRRLLLQGGGFARIFGPEGTPLGEDLAETEEGLVVADLDLSLISIAKSAADPVGHYSRPDVMRLLINRAPNSVVVEQSAPAAPLFVDAEELGRETVPAEIP